MNSTRGLFRFSRQFALHLWPWYLGGALFLAVTNLITLEIPQLAKQIVNSLQSLGQAIDRDHLSRLALSIVLLGFSQIVVRSLSRILIFWPGRKLEASSKSFIFGRVLHLPQRFFDRYGMGDLISRLSNDLGQLRVFFAFGILQVLNLCFITVFTLVKMFSVHPTLTLTALTPILFMVIAARFVMPRLQAFTKKNQEAIGTLTNRVTETFTSIHIVQSNAAEASFLRLIEGENEKVYESDMRVLVLRTLFFPLMTSLTGVSQLLVLFFGGYLVIQSQLSVGDILAFNFYLSYLAFPLTSIGIVLAIYQRSKTAIERLNPLIDEPLEAAHAKETLLPPAPARPLLQIVDLSFRYRTDADAPLVLNQVSLNVAEGEMVGICGPVGSGKSTLFQLLTRIYDPPAGTIRLEGQDILNLDPATLRQQIAYALQRVHLFSASIRDNLKLGLTPEPDAEALQTAAATAQLLGEIENFPAGWDTEIGEKGLRISGGQKQRLALARVFLRRPRLLLLDDVLSAVDNLTEARLIQELRKRKTAMLINSHRNSVLELCDRVVLIEEGKVRDQGRFSDLLVRHPHLQEEIYDSSQPESV